MSSIHDRSRSRILAEFAQELQRKQSRAVPVAEGDLVGVVTDGCQGRGFQRGIDGGQLLGREDAKRIGGLELLTFEPGDIIITEGEQGSSLFVLTSGVAKAFVRAEHGAERSNPDRFYCSFQCALTNSPRVKRNSWHGARRTSLSR